MYWVLTWANVRYMLIPSVILKVLNTFLHSLLLSAPQSQVTLWEQELHLNHLFSLPFTHHTILHIVWDGYMLIEQLNVHKWYKIWRTYIKRQCGREPVSSVWVHILKRRSKTQMCQELPFEHWFWQHSSSNFLLHWKFLHIRKHSTKWIKPDGERQIPYDLTYKWNLINKTNKQAKYNQRHWN